MTEVDPAVMVRALTHRDVLRVFAEVVAITGTGLPERSGDWTSIHYITAHGVSRATGLPLATVLGALKRLTDARLTIEEGACGGGWRTISRRFAAQPGCEADGRDEASLPTGVR